MTGPVQKRVALRGEQANKTTFSSCFKGTSANNRAALFFFPWTGRPRQPVIRSSILGQSKKAQLQLLGQLGELLQKRIFGFGDRGAAGWKPPSFFFSFFWGGGFLIAKHSNETLWHAKTLVFGRFNPLRTVGHRPKRAKLQRKAPSKGVKKH
jgi:hypothetical protein